MDTVLSQLTAALSALKQAVEQAQENKELATELWERTEMFAPTALEMAALAHEKVKIGVTQFIKLLNDITVLVAKWQKKKGFWASMYEKIMHVYNSDSERDELMKYASRFTQKTDDLYKLYSFRQAMSLKVAGRDEVAYTATYSSASSSSSSSSSSSLLSPQKSISSSSSAPSSPISPSPSPSPSPTPSSSSSSSFSASSVSSPRSFATKHHFSTLRSFVEYLTASRAEERKAAIEAKKKIIRLRLAAEGEADEFVDKLSEEAKTDDEKAKVNELRNTRSGRGAMITGGGTRYEVIEKDNTRYEGTIDGEGKKQGRGKLTYLIDGAVYEGNFVDGMRHGEGKLVYSATDEFRRASYEGRWSQDVREGFGIFTFKNGNVFRGFLENNEFVRGVMVYSEGSISNYSGEFKNFKPYGEGEFVRSDGSIVFTKEAEKFLG